MMWQTYENKWKDLINPNTAEKVESYLNQKEGQLASQILHSIHFLPETPPLVEPDTYQIFRLHEATEEFGKKIHRIAHTKQQVVSGKDWEVASEQIASGLMSYIKVLEESVAELFRQIENIGFEYWDESFFHTASLIKDHLIHHFEDFIWAVRRLEQQLYHYRLICLGKTKKWDKSRLKFWSWWGTLLGSKFEARANKSLKFIKNSFKKFVARYEERQHVFESTNKLVERFDYYRAIPCLDLDMQNRFKKLFFLLKIWHHKDQSKTLSISELTHSLKNFISQEGALSLFRGYLDAINHAVFDSSRIIKKSFRDVFKNFEMRKPLLNNLTNYREELHTLKSTVIEYQKFIKEIEHKKKGRWVRFPANKKRGHSFLKHFHELVLEIEDLDVLCAEFFQTLNHDRFFDPKLTPQIKGEIESHLNEMSQPLASKLIIEFHAEAVMKLLNYLDEVGSFDVGVSDYICLTLCRVMRADWRYHIVQELPLFHRIFEIHQAIVMPLENRKHLNRLHKFQKVLNHLEVWVNVEDPAKHFHEIQLDINDIKIYLQDFLAQVQHLHTDTLGSGETEQQKLFDVYQTLLEYRYLFSRFFHTQSAKDSHARLVRKELIFVEQYFEAVENILSETHIARPEIDKS